MQPRISISLPCYGRPERTRRALESIYNQTINNFEVLNIPEAYNWNLEQSKEWIIENRSCQKTAETLYNALYEEWGKKNEQMRTIKND